MSSKTPKRRDTKFSVVLWVCMCVCAFNSSLLTVTGRMVSELTMDKLSSLIYKEAEDKGCFLSSSFFLITQFMSQRQKRDSSAQFYNGVKSTFYK